MKFECPSCGQKLSIDTIYGGQAVQCPSCSANVTVPMAANAQPPSAETPEVPSSDVIRTLQSSIDRGAMTISRFMAEKQIEGGVDLQSSGDRSSASAILTADQGRKYKLGNVVASGGMGAILDAKDVNLRRSVAMKVIIDPAEASKDRVLRFIEEAQVTSQLEHPSIVPVHELGVDSSGNVFYTMKFVKGKTLKAVLHGIRAGDAATIRNYPLSHLLTIFQKVCDAMAFAHSKRVIHRDLKPENVMVGEYGEVQVMDWGLAKVLPKPELRRPKPTAKAAANRPQPANAIDSVRSDEVGGEMKTMAGSIMGTPGYMAPEQAMGKIDELDERADIYSLGAILYAILTLHPPVEGKDLADVLSKVTSGQITPPMEYNPKRSKKPEGKSLPAVGSEAQEADLGEEEDAGRSPPGESSLPHCSGGRIPESLGAVAMKALALEPKDRYRNVKDLQKEIEAYQNGFATSAEGAGTWKQFKLFVKRNKGVFATLAAMVLVLFAAMGAYTVVNVQARLKAQKALAAFQAEQARRQADRKSSAPALVEMARTLIMNKEFGTALDVLATAVEYDPGQADAQLLATAVCYLKGKHTEALEHCRAYAKLNPTDQQAKRLVTMCETAVKKGANAAPTGELGDLLSRKGMPALGAEFTKSAESKLTLYRSQVEKFWPGAGNKMQMSDDGKLSLDLYGMQEVTDLRPLQGIPLVWLGINRTAVKDLAPLKGMQLTFLNLDSLPISDLSPLKGMPLTDLNLLGTPVSDLGPLAGMPLTSLRMRNCSRVRDLSPLKGMPLKTFDIGGDGSSLADITPLKGMPLTSLNLAKTQVTDLAPLAGMPLTSLEVHGGRGVGDLSPLKGMPLTTLTLAHGDSPCLAKDLSPLRNMPLTSLTINGSPANDLAPLAGMPLTLLGMNGCREVSDLSPLKGLPLTRLWINGAKVTDLSPLKGMPLTFLELRETKVTDLTPLKGLPLTLLDLRSTEITDLTPLEGMNLVQLDFDPEKITKGLEVIRNMKSLTQIKGSAAEFWKKYDAGEFKR